jgi:SNF2 family DNA or RNA helicase
VKCLQIASGAVYTDDAGSWSELHDAKLQALDSILTEAAGAPVLVAYHWKHDLERVKAFPRGRHLDQDPQTLRDWNAGKIPVLFAHPASAGHGLNMQDGGNILVFFSHWWDWNSTSKLSNASDQPGRFRPDTTARCSFTTLSPPTLWTKW